MRFAYDLIVPPNTPASSPETLDVQLVPGTLTWAARVRAQRQGSDHHLRGLEPGHEIRARDPLLLRPGAPGGI